MAFEPHPQEYFRPSTESFRLTPFRTKARLIAEAGADALFALPFDAALAAKQADEFVRDVLVNALGVSCVVVGEDFQFGKGRSGNTTTLSAAGDRAGFDVEIFGAIVGDGEERVSSSRIRALLKGAKPALAARLLGRFWAVEARIEHGDGRGREIGFPTANMRLTDTLHPAFGIYAVRASILENDKLLSRHQGVASFGLRPMFALDQPLFETHLLDFSGDLYGKHLQVELITWLRAEMKLEGIEALKAQIARDCDAARAVLAA
jgi:riboflavin kinase/FMN adenylyltransferase